MIVILLRWILLSSLTELKYIHICVSRGTKVEKKKNKKIRPLFTRVSVNRRW